MTDKNLLPVVIIGAGPIGLAAAAHLLERGETPLVFEAGDGPGHAVKQWRHVSMFSPWEFNTDKAAVALLTASGWTHPPQDEIPTGEELVERYLEPLAALPALRPHLRFGARVVAVSRKGFDKVRTIGRADQPFVLRVATSGGAEEVVEAKAVIDASGTWSSPNPAGADGLPAIGELAAADQIFYGIPEVLGEHRARYAGKSVVVVGGGHSALNALIELADLREEVPATSITWVMRKENIEAAFGGEEEDALPARGALGSQARHLVESGIVRVLSPFRIARIERRNDGTLLAGGDHAGADRTLAADEIIVASGFRPDFSYLREIRLSLDPWLESSGEIGPLIDPNFHSCGTVRPHGAKLLAHAEPRFFIVGIKSYGRAPTFLLATGHEQVRSIAAALAGDVAAADRVELCLPKTGVCVSRPIKTKAMREAELALAEAASCCGTSATAEAVAPAAAKPSGCCGPSRASQRP
jgi:cation diffusion facilitator CzcD-associated flavoprotein CzcO